MCELFHRRCGRPLQADARLNVLHPWVGCFGLPAENAAIERGSIRKPWTEENIGYMKTQLRRMGLSYDWEP